MELTLETIQHIIHEQYPEFDSLLIEKMSEGGHDHHSYHLGNHFSLRFPSAYEYSTQVIKEYTYCKILQNGLDIPITSPIALGIPSVLFPFHFTINEWIDGETVSATNITNKIQFANDLANFLNNLHKCEIKNGPLPSKQNFYRGGSLTYYHDETIQAIKNCSDFDQKRCLEIWMKGVKSPYSQKAVWIHGDVAVGNLLVRNGKLSAVIDFGNMAIGDPACDYVMAWTYFDCITRPIFIKSLNTDKDTLNRTRAWALWKALISLNDAKHKDAAIYTLNEIFKEDT